MNIDALSSSTSRLYLKPSEPLAKKDSFSEYTTPREQLTSLSQLATHVLCSTSKMTQVIQSLGQKEISIEKTKLLFIESFIQSFHKSEQLDLLKEFRLFFDPRAELFPKPPQKERFLELWKGFIQYFTQNYIGFDAKSPSLTQLLDSEIKQSGYIFSEELLEEMFDKGTEFIIEIAKNPFPSASHKFLFHLYLAKLILQAEELLENEKIVYSSEFEECLGDLLYYLLLMPASKKADLPFKNLYELLLGDLRKEDLPKIKPLFQKYLIQYLEQEQQQQTRPSYIDWPEVFKHLKIDSLFRKKWIVD